MNNEPAHKQRGRRSALIRDLAMFQLKLVLDALRDLVLSPVALGAAVLDLILAGRQPPRWFKSVLRMGERSEHWIDLWSAARDADAPARANVDALLGHVEQVVSDPKQGARKARILRRWIERQMRNRKEPPVGP